MSEKKRVRKYFPNRIKEVMEIPAEMFGDWDFEDVYEKNWQLKPGKEFVIRGARRGRPMDVVERSFYSPHHAKNFVDELAMSNYEITIATNEFVAVVKGIDAFDEF